ncbi:MAG: type IV pilus secretin PilQ [Gammaproteobacteria bacterium]
MFQSVMLVRRSVRVLFTLCAALVATNATAQATLNNITYSSLPGDRVELRMELSQPTEEPLVFAIDNPARVAMDFPGVKLKASKKSQNIGVGLARSVAAVEASGRTRVVVSLVKLVPYSLARDGNTVVMTLQSAEATTVSAVSEQSTAKATPTGAAASASTAAEARSIENIDFRRGTDGEGRVLITLSDPSTIIDSRRKGNKVIIDFKDAQLPERLARKLDVIDFATPVISVDTYPNNGGVRVEIEGSNEFDEVSYQSDNLFTVDLRPFTKEEQEEARRRKFGYTGERLSLNFQNIEVRAVLQLIADFTGLNLVASDTVAGSLTLRLKNVPWDQALDIILKSKGLSMRQAGNVIMVAPSEEIAAREKLELEAQQQIVELAPLVTEFVQINYAKAQVIASLLKADGNSLLTERGNVSVDDRTNTLLIRDTREALDNATRLVSRLDVPVRQVLIESRIVIADNNFSKELGVRFGLSRNAELDNRSHGYTLGGKRPGDTTFFGPTGDPLPTSFNTDGIDNYIVSLPLANPAGALGFAIGQVGSSLLQLELDALEVEGRGEVLSNPRVITSNQTEAVIEQGTQIPFAEASSSGAATITFQPAVLQLKVTPQITPDDRVIMDLAVSQDTVGQVFSGVPSIDTRAIQTQVLVDNGETVVLGGVYEQTTRTDVTKVPLFGDLPYLGRLFRQDLNSDSRSELLIFVTPKILKESLALN